MQTSVQTTTPAALPAAVETLLRHFPEHVREAYVQLRQNGDLVAADTVVLAIVADHMPEKSASLVDSAALMDDLGLDSITIAEMVFFIEDLLAVNVTNAEIIRVRTVGELRAFVRVKLAAQNNVRQPAPRA
jgi:acyl carrier protein